MTESWYKALVQHLKSITLSTAEVSFCQEEGRQFVPACEKSSLGHGSRDEEVNVGISTDLQLCENDLLPRSVWGDEPEHTQFSSIGNFQVFLDELKRILESELQRHHYNTFDSFLDFYRDFLNQTQPLEKFYKSYEPTSHGLSCVGLGRFLIEAIELTFEKQHSQLKYPFFIASSREKVKNIDTYINFLFTAESDCVKDHVVVVLKVEVEHRRGCIVLDPGYHVSIPVVVMSDTKYPHTGWFLQSKTTDAKKEYNYLFHDNGNYIKWFVKKTKGLDVEKETNLIYIRNKFESYVSVTEKMNLVYHYRSLVARDKNQPTAGMCCNLNGAEEVIFFFKDEFHNQQKVSVPFHYFSSNKEDIEFEKAISSCVSQLGHDYSRTMILDRINRVIEAYQDKTFIPYVRFINYKLNEGITLF